MCLPATLQFYYLKFGSHVSRNTGRFARQIPTLQGLKKQQRVQIFACATSFSQLQNLKVLQLEMQLRSRYNTTVRGLRCEFKGFCGDAALPHCCDRRAFLLAFIFSRRFTRWLLVISISSILSRAVRSCVGREETLSPLSFQVLCHSSHFDKMR